ncbi:MAG: sialate O-acetylesterase [Mucilaginibacter sp.]
MRQGFFIAIVFLAVLQSCSKNNYQPVVTPNNADPIATSSGLKLDAVGSAGLYRFIASNGAAAGVANSSTTPGNSFDFADYAGTPFQKWQITRVTTSHYSIKNLGSNLYLQSYNNNGKEMLVQGPYTGTDAQLWSLALTGTRIYKAINKGDGLAINGTTNQFEQLQPYKNSATQAWGYNEVTADTLKATKFSIANVLQSNMVVQRDKPVSVWGFGTANTVVAVKVSWNQSVFTAVNDATGHWLVKIPAASANASPQTITASVAGKPVVKLTNILIGDVWICGGQSNMTMLMDSVNFLLAGAYNYKQEVAKANHPNVRYLSVPVSFVNSPSGNIGNTKWSVCSPATAGQYSALGYYFGAKLDSALHVPIGILVSAFAGTSAEAWTSVESIQADPILKAYYTSGLGGFYYGMISPLRNMSIKGFVWDQGESNANNLPASNYTVLHRALIAQWRTLFNQGDLPFYFVQKSPQHFGSGAKDFYSRFEEAQANVRATAKTGMAVSADVNEVNNAHYRAKAVIADRLARLAMRFDYNLQVAAVGPSYKSFIQTGKTISITFNNANSLKTVGPLLQVFTVAGDDKVFYTAQAAISGSTIMLTVPANVTTVRSVRYAFTNEAVSRLYNGDGLPMEPFRTDNW